MGNEWFVGEATREMSMKQLEDILDVNGHKGVLGSRTKIA